MLAEIIAVVLTLLLGPLAYVALNRVYRHRNNNWPVGPIDGFGDSVLLPWFNATAVHLGVLGMLPRQPVRTLLGLLLAVVLTAGFIYWRKDVAPYDDWSRPRKGSFNAAGWYHAVFMLLQSFFIFASLLLLWRAVWLWVPILAFAAVVLARFSYLVAAKQMR